MCVSSARLTERLREEQRRIAKSDRSILDKANAIAAIQNVRDALNKFWNGVADFLGIHFTAAEDVADKVLSDMLNGVNPNEYTYRKNGMVRKQLVGEKGAANMNMTEEERRNSLASETEDVAREDQIFLMENAGKAESLGDNFETFKGEDAIEQLNAFFDIKPSDLPTLPAPIGPLDAFKEVFAKPVRTVLGTLIKVKDSVFSKITRRERNMISGSILNVLQDADFVIKDTDGSKLYVKLYKNTANEHVYNVTVVNKQDEIEDYISSVHIKSNNNLRNKIENGAELLLPSKRTRYGEQAPSNSAPSAKIEEISETFNDKDKNLRHLSIRLSVSSMTSTR